MDQSQPVSRIPVIFNQVCLHSLGGFRRAPCGALLPPELAIQCAALDRFADVLGRDGFAAGEVGDGAGDFQDSIVAARTEVQVVHRHAQEIFRVGAERAEFADLPCFINTHSKKSQPDAGLAQPKHGVAPRNLVISPRRPAPACVKYILGSIT